MLAQNNEMYSLLYLDKPGCFYNIEGLMQQRDGDFILNTFVYEDTGDYIGIPLGSMVYKISPTTLSITDSLFIADTASWCLSMQNPHSEGNIRVNFEYHEDCDSCFLRICHFPDNNLRTNPEEDIITPLCEGYPANGWFSCMVDCRGDLILQYLMGIDNNWRYNHYVARFGVDGTLKYQTLLHENVDSQGIGCLYVLKESPLTYYDWDFSETFTQGCYNLIVYVTDSLFNNNPVIINSLLSEEAIAPNTTVHEHLYINGDTQVIPIGGDNILVASEYKKDTTSNPMTADYGVAVAKYDIRTMQLKGYIVFNDYGENQIAGTGCMSLKMMSDGTVYFLYKEDGYPAEIIVVVKMDTDLNVEWKRFYKTDNLDISPIFGHSLLYKDELGEEKGIAWTGAGKNLITDKYGVVFFLLNHEGPINVVSESGIEMRPYAFYPNPTREQVHMEFSPDVQPTQVELYDLQGRLVCTQSKAFESIDMSQLPAGTYTMRVTLEDGKVYSDKVVKE
jgi:hypothetical protein